MRPDKSTPEDRLIDAAAKGDTAKVQELLDSGTDPDCVSSDGNWTPLCTAAYRSHFKIASLLLSRGADPSKKPPRGSGGSPLWWAAAGGNDALLNLLIQKGAKTDEINGNGMTPLSMAAAAGKLNIVQALLQGGANVNAQDHSGNTPLMRAAMRGDTHIMQILLDAGADVTLTNVRGQTVLHSAAQKSGGLNDKTVRFLLQDKTRTKQLLNVQDMQGKTALMRVIMRRDTNMADLLLKAGADPDTTDEHGYTPLILAVNSRRREMVDLLLDKNVSLTRRDKNGDTALHHAARIGEADILETLLFQDAATLRAEDSPQYMRNKAGDTPFGICKNRLNGKAAAEVFRKWEAEEKPLRREFLAAQRDEKQKTRAVQRDAMRRFLRRPSNGR